ncbi:MAG: hypothetical protein AABY22_04635 [Nanoarchaeota archaeon]
MNNKLLIIYNICGLNCPDDMSRYDSYCQSIGSIINQDFSDHRLCISSCCNSVKLRSHLQNKYNLSCDFYFNYESVPVNITLNHSIQKCVEKYGEFAGYVYIDSGCTLNDDSILRKLYETYDGGRKYAMVSCQANNDVGDHEWGIFFDKELYEVPLDKALNLHVQLFDNEIYKTFNKKILPDIFASFCTEGSFSFICSALKKKWAHLCQLYVDHKKSLDGASACMNGGKHEQIFIKKGSLLDIYFSEEGKLSGIGYESYRGILPYDKSKFDKDGFPLNDSLLNFIKNNLYLKEDEFSYNDMSYEFIERL